MVAGPAAADAVRRARTMPGLHVGLHLVVIEGPAVSPSPIAPEGHFASDQLRLGIDYFFRPQARRWLRSEIAAQFAAFAATGLPLDHANAHKHMHLHPTVGRLMIEEGRRHGLKAIRIPSEPPDVLRQWEGPPSLGTRALYQWTRLLRRQARQAGLVTNDHVFGLAWSGHMTADRVVKLLKQMPPGLSEIYFHPATEADATIRALMPDYEHAAELAALQDPSVREALLGAGLQQTTWLGGNAS
jgi:chitin disaccharide deacetylase